MILVGVQRRTSSVSHVTFITPESNKKANQIKDWNHYISARMEKGEALEYDSMLRILLHTG